MSRSSHQSGIAGDTAFRPTTRTLDLITTETKDEVLLYDQLQHHIHHMNPVTTAVWRACDGTRTVEQIIRHTGFESDSVYLALRQLDQAALLDGPLPEHVGSTGSRRAFMKKVGIAAVPAIVSTSAPVAKAAASGGSCLTPSETGCRTSSDCCQYPGTSVVCIGYIEDSQPGVCTA